MYMDGFLADIDKMNAMYECGTVGQDTLAMIRRIEAFEDILKEEIKEIEDIGPDETSTETIDIRLAIRTDMADLLGDVIVYCASEALRWNIPIDNVLSIIMQSNFSKLDADGKPIKDERGKFLKGPNYWKPEPKIAQLLKE